MIYQEIKVFFVVLNIHVLFSVFRYGRRFATLSSLFGLLLCGVGSAFSPNIYVYIILKFFCGVTGLLMIQATVIGQLRTAFFKPVKKSLSCLQGPRDEFVELKVKQTLSLHDVVIQEKVKLSWSRRHRVDWSLTLGILHHNDPAFLPCWTDAAAWNCLFDQQLEDTAAHLFQPSDSPRGIVLLVGIFWSH